MFDPASRFSITESPEMAPAKDFITGQTEGLFVDTHRDVQFSEIGRLYLSVDTVREMAEGLGLFDELKQQAEANAEARYAQGWAEGVAENGALVESADRVSSALDRVRSGLLAPAPSASVGTEPADDLPHVTDGSVRGDHEADSERPARSGGKRASTRGQRRPALVSGDPSDGPNPFRVR